MVSGRGVKGVGLSGQRMPTGGRDGIYLGVTAPFLLFPAVTQLGTIFALCLTAFIWLRGIKQTPKTPFNVPLLIFSVMIGVGIFVSPYPGVTLPKATGLILGLTIWRFVAIYSSQPGMWRLFFLLGAVVISVGAATTDWQAKMPAFSPLTPFLPRWRPAFLKSVHPNQLAGTLLIYLPLVASLAFGAKRRRQRFGRILGVACLSILLAFTQSRAGWAGGIAGIFVVAFLWLKGMPPGENRRRWALWLLFAALFLGFGLAGLMVRYLPALLAEPATVTPLGEFSSLQIRRELWRWAAVAIGDFPITGMGLGIFRIASKDLYPITTSQTIDIAHAHNIYLQTGVDVGLPGLIAYLALLTVAGIVAWQRAIACPHQKGIYLGIIGALVALHIFGLGDALALGSKSGGLFWWLLGALSTQDDIDAAP